MKNSKSSARTRAGAISFRLFRGLAEWASNLILTRTAENRRLTGDEQVRNRLVSGFYIAARATAAWGPSRTPHDFRFDLDRLEIKNRGAHWNALRDASR